MTKILAFVFSLLIIALFPTAALATTQETDLSADSTLSFSGYASILTTSLPAGSYVAIGHVTLVKSGPGIATADLYLGTDTASFSSGQAVVSTGNTNGVTLVTFFTLTQTTTIGLFGLASVSGVVAKAGTTLNPSQTPATNLVIFTAP